MKIKIILLLFMISSLFITGCASNEFKDDPLNTVETLDLEKYLGRWYEIARFQSGFEKNIYGATAEYSLREDGRIQVINSGFKKSLDGPYKAVKAVAWRPNDEIPGALKVKFFSLFTSDYLVIALDDENYEWALVGSNSRKYIWFLSRTPNLSEEIFSKLKNIAIEEGYDLSNLFLVPQKLRE